MKRYIKLGIWLVIGYCVLSIVFSFFFGQSVWQFNAPLAVAVHNTDSSVDLAIFDPVLKNTTVINLKSETPFTLTRNLGEWKLGSVWEIGENEKLGGKLLSDTLTKTFHLPVLGWADSNAQSFLTKNPLAIIKAIFSQYKTNLSLKDKLKLGLFALSSRAPQKNDSATDKQTLLIFTDPLIAKEGSNMILINESGQSGVVYGISPIIETLGGKIASIVVGKESDIDCEIFAKDKEVAQKLNKIFACEIKSNSDPSLDNAKVVMRVGKAFAKRY